MAPAFPRLHARSATARAPSRMTDAREAPPAGHRGACSKHPLLFRNISIPSNCGLRDLASYTRVRRRRREDDGSRANAFRMLACPATRAAKMQTPLCNISVEGLEEVEGCHFVSIADADSTVKSHGARATSQRAGSAGGAYASAGPSSFFAPRRSNAASGGDGCRLLQGLAKLAERSSMAGTHREAIHLHLPSLPTQPTRIRQRYHHR